MDTTNGAQGHEPMPDDSAAEATEATSQTTPAEPAATTPVLPATPNQPEAPALAPEAVAPAEAAAPVPTAPTVPVQAAPAAAPAAPAAPTAPTVPVQAAPPAAPYLSAAPQGQQIPGMTAGQAVPGTPGTPGTPAWQPMPGWQADPSGAAPQYMWAPVPPAADARKRKRRNAALITGAFVTAAIFGVGTSFGIAAATGAFGQSSSNSSNAQRANTGPGSSFGLGGEGGYSSGGNSFGGGSGTGSGSGSGSDSQLPNASSAQQVGVVDVVSQLTYDGAESAGTGLVLTSNGEILTNNHVVEDSTSISVTIVSTGKTYTASVVGTDATDDIAVLKLTGVSGLSKANINSSANVSVGDAITGVGNAGGTGGTPTAAAGSVTATNQTITTEAEASAKSETLNGLIETNADIQAGDSGGPLYNSSNQVIGIDTAASSGSSTAQGYAIPIASALSIAKQIESGDASSTVSIGYPPFLGVEVQEASDNGGLPGSIDQGGASTTSGASVGEVINGTPAASAGLAAGDTITAVNGTAIGSASDLTAALAKFKPGQSVTITWVDGSGATQSANVTLTTGPVA